MKQLPREEREEKWTRCVARRENALSARTRRWILSPVTNAPFSLFRWTEAGQRVPDVGKRSCYMVMHHRERLMNHVANSLLKWITAGLAIMILPLSCPWKFRLRGRDRGPASTTDWFPVTAQPESRLDFPRNISNRSSLSLFLRFARIFAWKLPEKGKEEGQGRVEYFPNPRVMQRIFIFYFPRIF